ncbi:hypothetical protein D9M71_655680 [compost metagenome]
MRICLRAYSIAAVFVSPTTACLAAPYAASLGAPPRPAIEATFRMTPPPCASICRIWCFMPKNTPLALTAKLRSNSSSSVSMKLFIGVRMPALLMPTSSRAKVPTAASTSAFTSASRVTSQVWATTLAPPSRSSPANCSRPDTLRSPSTSLAPTAARRRASNSPKPLAAPVIITTWSL